MTRPRIPTVACATLIALGTLLGGCATPPPSAARLSPMMPSLRLALDPVPPNPPAPTAASAPAGMATPARAEPTDELAGLPTPRQGDRRFSVVLNGALPEVVFMTVLSETPLSVAVDSRLKAPMSVSLKDVTVREALELLRELHDFEYKIIGRHIVVSPAQMQTRLYKVDYPSFNRSGRSDLRVVSGSITGGSSAGSGGSGTTTSGSSGSATGSSSGSSSGGSVSAAGPESSRITTSQSNNLWSEIEASIKLIIGERDGRSVVISPQTGSIVVRALPSELRSVTEYLESARAAVQRQVMLEAKVVEVQLRDSERTGINWAAFKAGLSTRASAGALLPGGSLSPTGEIAGGLLNVTPGSTLENAATSSGALLGLAFQTSNFAAVLEFLGTQGNTQVLSSPRIATMNNQKALLKVGTDDFFVTNISTTTTAVGNTASTTPNISVQPFFSGISLDVTPQIDAEGYITLHIHPAVSNVTERSKVLNLGTQGTYSLPLASSDINESDAVVRAYNGHIIAIGGLMRQTTVRTDSGLPGVEEGPWRKLLGGSSSSLTEKRELVILMRPTVIDPGNPLTDGRRDSLNRLMDWLEQQESFGK